MERGDDPDEFAARFERRCFAGPARPTAMIASNTLIGVWAIRAIQRARTCVARATSRSWCSSDPDWADLLQPRLAVVEPADRGDGADRVGSAARADAEERCGAMQRIELKSRFVRAPSVGAAPLRHDKL